MIYIMIGKKKNEVRVDKFYPINLNIYSYYLNRYGTIKDYLFYFWNYEKIVNGRINTLSILKNHKYFNKNVIFLIDKSNKV